MEAMTYNSIGVINSPYEEGSRVPYQPVETDAEGDSLFFVDLFNEYKSHLYKLDSFCYIYLLYHIDRVNRPSTSRVCPAWAGGKEVGVFASRSPARPNPIGLSVVRLISVDGSRIYTSGLDVFNGTPLLDIKPYIKDLDSKSNANYGWIDELPDRDHLMLHINGEPHDY